jgi:hypothetical protein
MAGRAARDCYVEAANFAGALTVRRLAGASMPDLLLTSNGPTETDEEDYDVTSDGRLVGHIFKPTAAPVETPWMWAFVSSQPTDRFPAPHGYYARGCDAGLRACLVRVKLLPLLVPN